MNFVDGHSLHKLLIRNNIPESTVEVGLDAAQSYSKHQRVHRFRIYYVYKIYHCLTTAASLAIYAATVRDTDASPPVSETVCALVLAVALGGTKAER